MFRIGPETQMSDLRAAAAADPATAILGGGFMDVPSLRRSESDPGASATLERMFEPGRWLVGCVTSPSGSDRLLPAAIVLIED